MESHASAGGLVAPSRAVRLALQPDALIEQTKASRPSHTRPSKPGLVARSGLIPPAAHSRPGLDAMTLRCSRDSFKYLISTTIACVALVLLANYWQFVVAFASLPRGPWFFDRASAAGDWIAKHGPSLPGVSPRYANVMSTSWPDAATLMRSIPLENTPERWEVF
jgi:hypothetical protein